MKGFIGLTTKEKEDIIKQHSKQYNGYAVGNVNTNTYPISVYDNARDKGGITLDNQNNPTIYKNHKINEITAKPLNYDELDVPYEFESDGPQQSMTQMGMGKKPYEFKSKGPVDVYEEPDFDDLLGDDEKLEKERDEIEESVIKTIDMFNRFKKFN
jgi:hypothetical protein